MSVTSTDIVNQALLLIGGNQEPVTGTAPSFDDSAVGKAAAILYAPCVATVARQFGWDFARNTVTLQLSGNTPPAGWAFQYRYPPSGVEVWDIYPANEDQNDPLPYDFNVSNDVVSGSTARVINTNLQDALAVYNNNPNESAWDSLFREEVVRLLASELANAIAGKPDLAQGSIDAYSGFAQIGESRQN